MSQAVVVSFLVDFEVPHLDAGDVAIFVPHVWEHLEQAFSLIVMGLLLVGELDVGVDMRGGCRVNVVKSTLRHRVEDFVQVRFLNLLFVSEEVVKDHVI